MQDIGTRAGRATGAKQRLRARALLLALGLAGALGAALAHPAPPPVTGTAAVEPAPVQWLARASASLRASAIEQDELLRLYRAGGHAMRWLDGQGRPSANATAALALIEHAAAEGLEPDDYRPEVLAGKPLADAPEEWDVALSLGMLRYLRQLHFGRVDPRTLGFRLPAREHEHDFAAGLDEALRQEQLPAAAQALVPPLAQYRGLRDALQRYRAVAAQQAAMGWSGPLPADAGEAAALSRVRLQALGDLAPAPLSTDAPGHVPDAALAAAIRRFQIRHGLPPDGKLGTATRAALDVPPARRARQIELAMERLRWLPHLQGRPFIAVNIPMFRLWTWPAALEMDVIVGRAVKTQTPVFTEDMRYLVFRPYWDVPASILRQELLPALRRNPSYLARQDMEIVSGAGDQAQVLPAGPDTLALLERGLARVRQRPGPKNALGQAKFIFPNDHNVYLHSTPAPALFGRSRRDFSHGCIRVQDPVALAQWVLQDQPSWTRARIEAAMANDGPLRVDLNRSIPVIVYYVTAAVMPQDGGLHFAEDLYGHDRRLEQWLQAHQARR
ncbi:L,D-transpeptidase family protein [Eleftheria terrae]|uniref:L,D-transpeptidase family protein n=1 Tax=Eleftheria terrae TaxID=1597781 RepID=UPI00263B26AC|nr:L,D-transpeptidase family protein [Eleftheria terrae]WKB55522.1 L,D-transpeptidase family protein [Eleftheria terrae]